MALPNDVSRCDGVKTGEPGAYLCRQCRRTEPGSDGDWQPFIAPAMVIESGAGGAYTQCPNYLHSGIDIDAVNHRLGAVRVAAEA